MADQKTARQQGRRKLLLLALFAISPVVASYVAYSWFVPAKRVNYGTLLDARPAPGIAGWRGDGTPFALSQLQGRWLLVIVTGDQCADSCLRALYATRQARTMQGKEQERVVRVWLWPADISAPPLNTRAPHPDLIAARFDREALAQLPLEGGSDGILIIDPHGNLVLRYGADPDIRRLAKDLERLLRASQIGSSDGRVAEPMSCAMVESNSCPVRLGLR